MTWRGALVVAWATTSSGCLLFSDLDASPAGDGGGSPTGTGSASSGSGTSNATSTGAGATTASSATTTSGAGGGGGSPVRCEGELTTGPTSGSGGGTGAGGCELGTATDCMACGHDCGPGASCTEVSPDNRRCSPANVGVPADNVLSIGVRYGTIFAFETTPAVYRYDLFADDSAPRSTDTDSPCDDACTLAVGFRGGIEATADGTAYAATGDGKLVRCPVDQGCVEIAPSPAPGLVGRIRLRDDVLFFTRRESGAAIASLSLDPRGTVEEVATVEGTFDVDGFLPWGDGWLFASHLLDDVPPGGIVQVREDGAIARLPTSMLPTVVATDGETLYWREGGGVVGTGADCQPRVLVAGNGSDVEGWLLEVDSTFVYFNTADGQLHRCPKTLPDVPLDPNVAPCDGLGVGSAMAEDGDWLVLGAGSQVKRLRKAP